MTLVIGCDLGRSDRTKVANTISVLDGILRGQSVFDPEVLPNCFRAREALKHNGARALQEPIVLWAIMRRSHTASSDRVFSLDFAWLTLDDSSIAGVYFLCRSGSVPQPLKYEVPLEWVDGGTAYSVRFEGNGDFKVVKDLSVQTLMRLGLLLVAFNDEEAKTIPEEWRKSTIVLPPKLALEGDLSFGLLLRNGNLSNPTKVLRRDKREIQASQ